MRTEHKHWLFGLIWVLWLGSLIWLPQTYLELRVVLFAIICLALLVRDANRRSAYSSAIKKKSA